jgi:cardiolipin synthase
MMPRERAAMKFSDNIYWLIAYITIAWMIRVLMVPTVLRRQFAPGAAVAWLGIVFLHPYVGLTLFLTVGENRLGAARVARHRRALLRYRPGVIDQSKQPRHADLSLPHEAMILQAEKISGLPVLAGNQVEFFTDTPAFAQQLIAEIDASRSQVHLLYYIFTGDSTGAPVIGALERAAARGVKCRVMADALASRAFFHRSGPARQLIAAGVQVTAAMQVAPIRRGLPRMDLRNHRKLAVIDGSIGFVGSHNLIDPDYHGRRGAPWVDVSARYTGSIVGELSRVFAEDWAFETDEFLDAASPPALAQGTAMQIVPSGPSSPAENYRRLLLAAVQSAREKLILTTPYFVPDEPTLISLKMAANRGVEVSLILPEVPDHIFTAAAGRAHFASLMEEDVRIFLYRPGLLHAKTTTVDDGFAIMGSANLDVRSFNLNFELSVVMYGSQATQRLRAIQESYLADSHALDGRTWAKRSVIKRYTDSAITLLSPLL